MYLCAGVIDV
uniref:Uncharacterized protein n=1 Tax=Anguilla anguilla TaxID=7936 RepID=A0A0E9UG86_ANGAN